MIISKTIRGARALAASCGLLLASVTTALSDNALLKEVVAFEGEILFLNLKVPGMIVAAVRNGESAVVGFGAEGADKPDGNTIIRIGSISKAFAGQVLASMIADGKVRLTDRLQDYVSTAVKVPTLGGREITLLDLATHGAGLPREVERERDPKRPDWVSSETYMDALNRDKLLFAPGTGLLYSNYGFDLLGFALSWASQRYYGQLLKERAFDPLGLKDTQTYFAHVDPKRLFQGYGPDGKPIPHTELSDIQAAASGVYSTANDMVRWLQWHLDRETRSETRTLDHAAYVQRDGLNPVSGLDEVGHMNAMGLGWVVMTPQGNRPLILQKTGGRQGIFSYIAFSPARNVGVFVSINKFDVPAAVAMAEMANRLIVELAPR